METDLKSQCCEMHNVRCRSHSSAKNLHRNFKWMSHLCLMLSMAWLTLGQMISIGVLNLSVTIRPCCEMDCKFSCSDISSLRLGFVSTCLTCYAKMKCTGRWTIWLSGEMDLIDLSKEYFDNTRWLARSLITLYTRLRKLTQVRKVGNCPNCIVPLHQARAAL